MYALRTGVALVAFLTLGPDHNAEIFYAVIGIGEHQLAFLVDFGFGYTDTVLTGCTGCTGISLFTLCTGCTGIAFVTFCTDDIAKVIALAVGVGEHQLARRGDFCACHTDAVYTGRTGVTFVAFLALFTLFAFGADNIAEVFGIAVRIGEDKLALFVDGRAHDADTVIALFTLYALFTLDALRAGRAGFAFLALGSNDIAEVGSLPVGIGQHQLAVLIDNGAGHANAVLALFTDNLIQIDLASVRKGQHKLPVHIDSSRADTDAVFPFFALGTRCSGISLFALFALNPLRTCGSGIAFVAFFTLCAVFAIRADSLSEIDDPVIGQGQKQLAVFGKCGGFDPGIVLPGGSFQGRGKILFRAGIAVFLGNVIGRLARKGFKPVLHCALIAILHSQLVCRQAVFNRRNGLCAALSVHIGRYTKRYAEHNQHREKHRKNFTRDMLPTAFRCGNFRCVFHRSPPKALSPRRNRRINVLQTHFSGFSAKSQ